jgi:hypothetical protein
MLDRRPSFFLIGHHRFDTALDIEGAPCLDTIMIDTNGRGNLSFGDTGFFMNLEFDQCPDARGYHRNARLLIRLQSSNALGNSEFFVDDTKYLLGIV